MDGFPVLSGKWSGYTADKRDKYVNCSIYFSICLALGGKNVYTGTSMVWKSGIRKKPDR